jgi:hypothetical protein
VAYRLCNLLQSTTGVCVPERFVWNWITDKAERDFARIFRIRGNKRGESHADDPFKRRNHIQGKVIPILKLSSMNMYGKLPVMLHAFVMSVLDRGGQFHTQAEIFPWKEPSVCVWYEAGWKFSSSGIQRRVVSIITRQTSHTLSTLVSYSAQFRPWRRSQYIPSKSYFICELQGAISQKVTSFTITAMRTSNPTWGWVFPRMCLMLC